METGIGRQKWKLTRCKSNRRAGERAVWEELAGELDSAVATNVGRRRMRGGWETTRRAESQGDWRDRLKKD